MEIAEDGGVKVNSHMQTSIPDVFAAGDVCHAGWEQSPFWLQVSSFLNYMIFSVNGW